MHVAEIYSKKDSLVTAWLETERGQLDHKAAGSFYCFVLLADNLEELEVETCRLVVFDQRVRDLQKCGRKLVLI